MAGKNSGKVQETEAERAMAEVATARYADFKKRWQPIQQRAIDTIRQMGAEGSFERTQAAGQATGQTRRAGSQASAQLETGMANQGIRASSAKAKLAGAELGNREATALGINLTGADQQVDEAYAQGLQKIVALGRGQSSGATDGMGDAAGMAAKEAQASANAKLQEQAGYGQLAATAGGIYLGQRGIGV